MELSEISAVTELEVLSDVNKFLDAKWVLLKVIQNSNNGAEYSTYSLGWLRSNGNPIKPKLYDVL